MAKYTRFDPRNKKKNKNKYLNETERKIDQKQKRTQNWKEYLDYEENDLSSLRRETIKTV